MIETGEDTTGLALPRPEDFGFFADSPFMHPCIPRHDMGIAVEMKPYSMATDTLLISVTLACFVALAILYRYLRPFLWERTRTLLFVKSPAGSGPERVETGMESHARTLMAILASIMMGCVFGGYVQEYGRCYLPHVPFWIPPACYSASIMTYFLLKHQLHQLVCMVFFKKRTRNEWLRESSFLTSVETILFFCSSVVVVYGSLTPSQSLIVSVFPLIFVKIVLLIKVYTILFGRILRFLHFFMYFCALELVPALILWVFLNKITGNLTIT